MVLFKTLTYSQKIVLGFILLGLIGTILLALPISSKTGNWTPLLDSLFTSISALCVTGLTVYDTFTHWSFLGQLVIINALGGAWITCVKKMSCFGTGRYRKRSSNLRLCLSSVLRSRTRN